MPGGPRDSKNMSNSGLSSMQMALTESSLHTVGGIRTGDSSFYIGYLPMLRPILPTLEVNRLLVVVVPV